MSKFRYRPEIDGLRAIAVLLILLFHAGFGFPGGFVGVDVFFVISGFLITSLILKAQEKNEFSLLHFWERRIRRIIPAATFTTIIVLFAGFFLLLPMDFKDLADSAIAQQLLSSNIYFWLQLDYFAGPSELKPLLHTWSLSVEEQFYLGYPFLLVFCARFGRTVTASILALVGVFSFALSQWGVYAHPPATFFLLPTRAWELILGAMIVFLPHPIQSRLWLNNVLCFAGALGIFYAGLMFDAATTFPGANALIPCLGTALVIYSNGSQQNLLGKLLSLKPIVFVGLISYSLYLWHWPIFAYLRYTLGENVGFTPRLLAMLSSFVFAALSWHYIETPFRTGKKVPKSRKLIFGAALTSAAFLVSLGIAIRLSNGIPGRLPTNVQKIVMKDNGIPQGFETKDIERLRMGELPEFGIGDNSSSASANILVWGDSHAVVLAPLFDSLAKEHGVKGVYAAMYGVPPLLESWPQGKGKKTVKWNAEVLNYIGMHNITDVVLVACWSAYVDGDKATLLMDSNSRENSSADSQIRFRRSLEKTIRELRSRNINVWIVGQVPWQNDNPVRVLARAAFFEHKKCPTGVSLTAFREQQAGVNAVFDEIEGDGVQIIDVTGSCFDSSNRSIIGTFDESYYCDDDHLSPVGADRLLRPLLTRIFAKEKLSDKH